MKIRNLAKNENQKPRAKLGTYTDSIRSGTSSQLAVDREMKSFSQILIHLVMELTTQ